MPRMKGFRVVFAMRLAVAAAVLLATAATHPAAAYPTQVTRYAGLDCRWDECPLDEGDGGPADRAVLAEPSGAAFDAHGNFYVAQTGRGAIRKIDRSGVISTLTEGLRLNGWREGSGSGVAVGPDGFVYVTTMDGLVVKVDPVDGSQQIIAGVPSGDDGPCPSTSITPKPALSARLCALQGIAIDAQGSIFVVAARAGQVLKIDGAGTVRRVAGLGTSDWCTRTNDAGDGGSAMAARLCRPSGIVAEPGGSLLIADTGNHVVRRIDATGTIRTVAGSSAAVTMRPEPVEATCNAVVGHEETIAGVPLCSPAGLASDGLGGFYVADPPVKRIWHVSATGVMRPLVVTREGSLNDRLFPEQPGWWAAIETPTNVTLDATGNLYVVDTGDSIYGRVNKIEAVAL